MTTHVHFDSSIIDLLSGPSPSTAFIVNAFGLTDRNVVSSVSTASFDRDFKYGQVLYYPGDHGVTMLADYSAFTTFFRTFRSECPQGWHVGLLRLPILRSSLAEAGGGSSGSRRLSASRIFSSAASRRSSGESPRLPARAMTVHRQAPPARRRNGGGLPCPSASGSVLPPFGSFSDCSPGGLVIIAAAVRGSAAGPVAEMRLVARALVLRDRQGLRVLECEPAIDCRVPADGVEASAPEAVEARHVVVRADRPGMSPEASAVLPKA